MDALCLCTSDLGAKAADCSVFTLILSSHLHWVLGASPDLCSSQCWWWPTITPPWYINIPLQWCSEEVRQHQVILSGPTPSKTKCNIKWSVCLSTAIVLIFWRGKVHRLTCQANTMALVSLSQSECSCPLLTFVFEFELYFARAPQELRLCRPQRRVEEMPQCCPQSLHSTHI